MAKTWHILFFFQNPPVANLEIKTKEKWNGDQQSVAEIT